MGTKNKPGSYDCYANAEDDEPMFILLARDIHAPFLVRAWADMREAAGEAPSKIEEARACADAMGRWNERNRGRKPLETQQVFDLFKQGSCAPLILAEAESFQAEFAQPFSWEGSAAPSQPPPTPQLVSEPPPALPEAPEVDIVPPSLPVPPVRLPAVTLDPPPLKARGTVLGNVMTVPAGMNLEKDPPPSTPDAGTEKVTPTPAAVEAQPATQGRPPAPAPIVRSLTMRHPITLGVPRDFEMRYTPEFMFRAKTTSTNVKSLGVMTLLQWEMGNSWILYDPITQDFFQPDVYEYCIKGMGSVDVRAPRITPNHAIKIAVRYTGAVPDGFSFGDEFMFEFTLHGEAQDRRMM